MRQAAFLAGRVMRIARGIGAALRSRWGVFASVAAVVLAIDLFLPPVLLSIVRKPFDYFAFNAWLPEFPHYLVRPDISIQQKLEFIPNLALFWFTADSPFGGVDWGFAVTVGDLFRFLVFSTLLGLYFALLFHRRDQASVSSPAARLAHTGGVSGALASVLGISTGGCTVMGCGAPVIPVVGLAFAGLSSGTLALLANLSLVATLFVFIMVALGVAYLAWLVGNSADAGGRTAGTGAPAAERP
jgi:hypothetical protein